MAIPVLIIGRSGSGKSASMRNCVNKDFNLIRVLKKPLPFRGHIIGCQTDDYTKVMSALARSTAGSIILDDAGYLITNQFMSQHASAGGNAIYGFYNKIADHFWSLIDFVVRLPEEKIVYVVMHEEESENGTIKPKTIGKLLDEKVCIEGMFTIVLRSIEKNGKYFFVTQSADRAVSKTPMGMFGDVEIDNDMFMVDQTIREYYGLKQEEKTDAKTE